MKMLIVQLVRRHEDYMKEKKKDLVRKILNKKYLSSVYQPIVSLKDGSIHGYEALSRITAEDIDMNIAELFTLAGEYGYLWELEKLCRTNALKYAKNKPKGIKLFINIDGNVLKDSSFQKGFTKEKLDKFSVDINDVVLEITERSDFDDRELLDRIMKHYREQGYKLALDDLGAGYSGLNRLQIIKPNYVKIDYELVHEIQKDKSKKSLVRMLVRYCTEMEYKLIAEGIETEEELKCLIKLGVDFGQGFFLKKPHAEFKGIDKKLEKLIVECQKSKSDNRHKIGSIGKMGVVLHPSCSIENAASLFEKNGQLEVIVIIDKKCKFCGVVDREMVMKNIKIKGKDAPLEIIMNKDMIQVDADKSISSVIDKLVGRDEKFFYDPFIILKKERYYGIGTLRDVIVAIGKELGKDES